MTQEVILPETFFPKPQRRVLGQATALPVALVATLSALDKMVGQNVPRNSEEIAPWSPAIPPLTEKELASWAASGRGSRALGHRVARSIRGIVFLGHLCDREWERRPC